MNWVKMMGLAGLCVGVLSALIGLWISDLPFLFKTAATGFAVVLLTPLIAVIVDD